MHTEWLPLYPNGFKIYKTVSSRVVLYGCETWYLILREQIEGIWEQGAEKNIRIHEGGRKRRTEKIRNEKL
jgi:hypothetical protein